MPRRVQPFRNVAFFAKTPGTPPISYKYKQSRVLATLKPPARKKQQPITLAAMANMTFFRRALILLIALVAVNATQVMQRPDNYKDAPHKFQTEIPPKTTIIHKRANAKVSAAYFTNWGIYGANFRKRILYHSTYIAIDFSNHL